MSLAWRSGVSFGHVVHILPMPEHQYFTCMLEVGLHATIVFTSFTVFPATILFSALQSGGGQLACFGTCVMSSELCRIHLIHPNKPQHRSYTFQLLIVRLFEIQP